MLLQLPTELETQVPNPPCHQSRVVGPGASRSWDPGGRLDGWREPLERLPSRSPWFGDQRPDPRRRLFPRGTVGPGRPEGVHTIPKSGKKTRRQSTRWIFPFP